MQCQASIRNSYVSIINKLVQLNKLVHKCCIKGKVISMGKLKVLGILVRNEICVQSALNLFLHMGIMGLNYYRDLMGTKYGRYPFPILQSPLL